MPARAIREERGIASVDYAGVLAVVAVVFGAFFLLDVDGKVGPVVEKAVCQILGGDCGGEQSARAPESAWSVSRPRPPTRTSSSRSSRWTRTRS